jgi:hypothetical protein
MQRQQENQTQGGALRQRGEQHTTGQGQRENETTRQGQRSEDGKAGTARQGQREERNLGKQGQRSEQPGTRGQAEREGKQGQREQTRQGKPDRDRPATTGQRPEGQPGEERGERTGQRGREGGVNERGGREGQVGERGVTEERGGGNATFTSEQRTHIRETVLEGRNVPRVSNLNFSLNAGTVVPERIHVIAVPEVIVEYHPAWRGYFYFVVNDEIVIVDRRHRIVAVITV